MKEHIKKVLIKAAKTNNFALIVNELSLEERNYLIGKLEGIVGKLDKEVIDILNENINLFMSSLYTEKEAISLLESTKIDDDDKKLLSILALPTDLLKIKYLDKLEDDASKSMIINRFKTDTLKIKALDKLEDDSFKFEIINNFEKDELKIQGLDKLKINYYIIRIISNFNTDELKIQILDRLEDDSSKSAVISSFKTDELKIQVLDKLENDSSKSKVINSFKIDKLKIQALDKIEDDFYRFTVINNLKTDELKIQALDKFEHDSFKFDVIYNLKTDELKIQALDKLETDDNKSLIINSLKTDELKIQALDKLKHDYNKFVFIEVFKTAELKIQGLDKLETDYYKSLIIEEFQTDELKLQCLDKLEDESYRFGIIKRFRTNKLKIQCLDKLEKASSKSKILSAFKSDDSILSFLIELEDKNAEKHKKIKDICQIKYKDQLSSNYSKIIVSNEEIFNKFITLFNHSNAILNKQQIDTVLETVLPKEFQQNKKEVWEIFSRIKRMSNKGEVDNITQELLTIIKYSKNTKNLVGKELKQFIIDIQNDSNFLKNFIIKLVDQSKPKVRELALDKLKMITSQYINIQMEDYKIDRKKQIFTDNLLGIDRKVDRNYLLKYITEHYDTDTLSNLIEKFYPEPLSSNAFTNGITLKEVLEWKTKDPKNAPKEIKLGFKGLNKILVQLYDEHYDKLYAMLKAPKSEIKYDEKLEIDNSTKLAELLLTCNLNEFLELCLKENHEKYKKIMDVIKKYHLIGLGTNFNQIFEENDIASFDIEDFIKNILSIATTLEKKKKINLKVVLDAYNLLNENLAKLLGKDNARLLMDNPPPNSSSMKKYERLDKALEYIRYIYQRKIINVPPIKEDISLENGKSLSVNLGNFTNAINLTYGEWTGSCMRIGGVGKELLDFCLKNPAGFHIRFSSKNKEFVSRVSGFRVGNTVFLNELRNSVSSKFTDEDVRLACQNVANRLIELSKDSESPIENVVIANEYVFEKIEPTVNFGVSFAYDGKQSPGYFDVDQNNCVLLATSNQEKSREYVPFKDTKMPEYAVLRDDVRYLDDPDKINDSINKLKMINNILQGKKYNEGMNENEHYEYTCAYIGEDFYVAVDKDGNIDTHIMPNTNNRKKAEIEVKEALGKLKNLAINTYTKQNNIVSSYTKNTSKTSPECSSGGRSVKG